MNLDPIYLQEESNKIRSIVDPMILKLSLENNSHNVMSILVDSEKFRGYTIGIWSRRYSYQWQITIQWSKKKNVVMPYDVATFGSVLTFKLPKFEYPLTKYKVYHSPFDIEDRNGIQTYDFSYIQSPAQTKTKIDPKDPVYSLDEIRKLSRDLVKCVIDYQRHAGGIARYNRKVSKLEKQLEELTKIGEKTYLVNNYTRRLAYTRRIKC